MIEIFSLQLTSFNLSANFLNDVLSHGEKERAGRFKFREHRRNFVLSHGILHWLLSRKLGCTPREVQWEFGQFGKPFLPDCSFSFNMSHSHEVALYAISSIGDIGVDVEYVKPSVAFEDLPWDSLMPEEQTVLLKASPKDRREIFYQIWTKKEAVGKALGIGLSAISKNIPSGWNFYMPQLPSHYYGAIAFPVLNPHIVERQVILSDKVDPSTRPYKF